MHCCRIISQSSNWLRKQPGAIKARSDSETDVSLILEKASVLKSTRMLEALKWLKKWARRQQNVVQA